MSLLPPVAPAMLPATTRGRVRTDGGNGGMGATAAGAEYRPAARKVRGRPVTDQALLNFSATKRSPFWVSTRTRTLFRPFALACLMCFWMSPGVWTG